MYTANYYKVYKERRAQLVSNSDKELLQTIVLLPPSFYLLHSNNLYVSAHLGECVLSVLVTLQLRSEP